MAAYTVAFQGEKGAYSHLDYDIFQLIPAAVIFFWQIRFLQALLISILRQNWPREPTFVFAPHIVSSADEASKRPMP